MTKASGKRKIHEIEESSSDTTNEPVNKKFKATTSICGDDNEPATPDSKGNSDSSDGEESDSSDEDYMHRFSQSTEEDEDEDEENEGIVPEGQGAEQEIRELANIYNGKWDITEYLHILTCVDVLLWSHFSEEVKSLKNEGDKNSKEDEGQSFKITKRVAQYIMEHLRDKIIEALRTNGIEDMPGPQTFDHYDERDDPIDPISEHIPCIYLSEIHDLNVNKTVEWLQDFLKGEVTDFSEEIKSYEEKIGSKIPQKGSFNHPQQKHRIRAVRTLKKIYEDALNSLRPDYFAF